MTKNTIYFCKTVVNRVYNCFTEVNKRCEWCDWMKSHHYFCNRAALPLPFRRAFAMLDRIKALMAARQLSPSQFADLTTLPRPVVSHILSGRNRPSLEVAQKIMAAFPDVSLDWFLNGRGAMTGSAPVATEAPAPAAAQPATSPRIRAPRTPLVAVSPPATALPSAGQAATEPVVVIGGLAAVTHAAPDAGPFAGPFAGSDANVVPSPVPPVAATPAPAAPAATTVAMAPPAPAVVQQVIRPERVVRRIMVFYSDGTFSDHRPLPAEEASFF